MAQPQTSGPLRPNQKYVLDAQGRRLIEERYDGHPRTMDALMRDYFTPRGIPREIVRTWARRLGKARPATHRPWTPKELAELEAFYARTDVDRLASRLGRSRLAVELKARELGLSKLSEGFTKADLSESLSVGHSTIDRWVTCGWLKGSHRKTQRTAAQGGDLWYFTAGAVRDFICKHPLEIRPQRLTAEGWLWLVDILCGRENGLGELARMREDNEDENDENASESEVGA